MSKRRLGRGLDALLADEPGDEEEASGSGVQAVPLDMIQPGAFQPRQHMDEAALQELAESVRTQGIVQPIVVRTTEEGGDYELIAGERRWRAAQLAGLETIPAMVRDLSDDQALEIALIENIQREELTPVEEARAFERLTKEFGLTHDALAEAVGRKRATISNTLRLLRLPQEVQKALEEGDLRTTMLAQPDPRTIFAPSHSRHFRIAVDTLAPRSEGKLFKELPFEARV
ncbi:MAG: ParB/RepB/Spo0J family partition protein, partial [Thiohalorhabdaceae bacterium]